MFKYLLNFNYWRRISQENHKPNNKINFKFSWRINIRIHIFTSFIQLKQNFSYYSFIVVHSLDTLLAFNKTIIRSHHSHTAANNHSTSTNQGRIFLKMSPWNPSPCSFLELTITPLLFLLFFLPLLLSSRAWTPRTHTGIPLACIHTHTHTNRRGTHRGKETERRACIAQLAEEEKRGETSWQMLGACGVEPFKARSLDARRRHGPPRVALAPTRLSSSLLTPLPSTSDTLRTDEPRAPHQPPRNLIYLFYSTLHAPLLSSHG